MTSKILRRSAEGRKGPVRYLYGLGQKGGDLMSEKDVLLLYSMVGCLFTQYQMEQAVQGKY